MVYEMLVYATVPLGALAALCYLRVRRGTLRLSDFLSVWIGASLTAGVWWHRLLRDGGLAATSVTAAFAIAVPLAIAALVFAVARAKRWSLRATLLGGFGISAVPAYLAPVVTFWLHCFRVGCK